MKTAAVRFYFDADILGLGKVVASLRADVTYPGDPGAVIHRRQRPPCVVASPAAKDTAWIPAVSRQGLVIVTRDAKIQQHRAEIRAVLDNGARMVVLSANDAGTVWAQLEVVATQWRRIDTLASLPGPWIYTATRTTLAKIA